MPNLVRMFHDRCERGFTVHQKVLLGIAMVIWIVSPVDPIPFCPIDDWGVIYALFRVLASRTGTGTGGDSTPPAATVG